MRDEKISLFLRKYSQEQREIIDYIYGLIFEFFPSIKEEINENNLKYISAERGSLFLIKVKNQNVRFYFKKKKISFNHTFEKEKSYYYIKYESIKDIKRNILIEIFNSY